MPLLNVVVDLSHHNTVSSFEAVNTEGSTFVDGDYEERRALALAAGMRWGAYHFGVRGHVQDQVDHFLNTVNPGQTDLLVLDFEPNPTEGTMRFAEAEEFVTRVQAQTGRFPGLYSGQAFLREQFGNRTGTVLQQCFLWIARYNTLLPQVPPAFSTFTLWQYTDGSAGPQPHRVPGIGRCDRDKFNGDETGLRQLWNVERA